MRKRTNEPTPTPVHGLLVLATWGGTSVQRVWVVGHTPKRFRIRAAEGPVRLPKGRVLAVGEETLVPKTAVRITGEGVPKGWTSERLTPPLSPPPPR